MVVEAWVKLPVTEATTNSTKNARKARLAVQGQRQTNTCNALRKKAPGTASDRKLKGAESWLVAILPESRAALP
jgi:hypothetical protein